MLATATLLPLGGSLFSYRIKTQKASLRYSQLACYHFQLYSRLWNKDSNKDKRSNSHVCVGSSCSPSPLYLRFLPSPLFVYWLNSGRICLFVLYRSVSLIIRGQKKTASKNRYPKGIEERSASDVYPVRLKSTSAIPYLKMHAISAH